MPLEYDLVVVGGTLAGRYAAIAAARTGARVALAELPGVHRQRLLADTFRTALRQSGWAEAKERAVWAAQVRSQAVDWALLPTLGIDTLRGQVQFEPARRPQLQVAGRSLRSRACLLAVGCLPRRAAIAGLANCLGRSPADLLQLPQRPNRVAVVGHQAAAVEWSLALAQAGAEVTLVHPKAILAAEDFDIQRLATAQLRAVGVRCLPAHRITKAQPLGSGARLWVAASNTSALPEAAADFQTDTDIEADCILLPDAGMPDVAGLRLPAAYGKAGIECDRALLTSHPRIYAIGAILGGEDRLELALQELQVAVYNALFWYSRPMRYECASYAIDALSPIGRAGLTEQQVSQQHRPEVYCASAVPAAETPYAIHYAKIIAADDRLLGLHLMGADAPGLSAVLAGQLGSRLSKLGRSHLALTALSPQAPLLAALFAQAALQPAIAQWQPHRWRRDWAENWFNWRRSRD